MILLWPPLLPFLAPDQTAHSPGSSPLYWSLLLSLLSCTSSILCPSVGDSPQSSVLAFFPSHWICSSQVTSSTPLASGNHPPRRWQPSRWNLHPRALGRISELSSNLSLDISMWILHGRLKCYSIQSDLGILPKPTHCPMSPRPNKQHRPHTVTQASSVTSCSPLPYTCEMVMYVKKGGT